MAVAQVRGGLSSRLQGSARGAAWDRPLSRVLQPRAAASGPRLPDTRELLPNPREESGVRYSQESTDQFTSYQSPPRTPLVLPPERSKRLLTAETLSSRRGRRRIDCYGERGSWQAPT